MATFLYNPDRKPKTELIAEFVVRIDIYQEIMHDLESSKMDHPEQHYLLVGQRGAGKTTLLNRLKYGIEDSKVLKNKVVPIIFSEEQYNISELVNLWESIAQHLEDYHGFENLYDEVEVNQAKENFEELSYEILEKHLKGNKKKLVLLVDNIGDILKKMDKTEVHRLREILQTKSEIRLIAGSPFYLETVLDYQQPLFEFFKVLRLDGLNQKETQELLIKLGEVNGGKEKIEKIIGETPERIETLRTLTGGVPRTIALMFNVFIEYNNEDTVKDLEKILDAVTPLYKHRMDDLPTQQQKIVDAVAKNWDGISVKDLKEKVRIESKTVSAQLRQLEKNQLIETVETGTKNKIYFLKERFFNIWYLMRYGRKYDKQRVIWLVKFLESWCSASEIEVRVVDYVNKLKEGKLNNQLTDFYGEVYTAMANLRSEIKFILKENAPSYFSKRVVIEQSEMIRLAQEMILENETKKAFQIVQQVRNPSETEALKMMSVIIRMLINDKGIFLESLDQIIKRVEAVGEDSIELTPVECMIMITSYITITFSELSSQQFEEAHANVKKLIDYENQFKGKLSGVFNLGFTHVILTFLAYGQENVILSIFEEKAELKDKFKPLYYVTLKIAKNNGYLSLNPEIKKTVDDLLQEVQDLKSKNEIKNSNPTKFSM